jgi:phosphohistidine phosphatase SixA
MRHGATHRKGISRDQKQIDFSRCETQRNLSDEGIIQVNKIGKSFESLQIPVSSVHSSPYCRTKATAQAVFGHYQVDEKLAFSMAKEEKESIELGQYLYNAMLQANTSKGNAVFVGHTANLKDGLGVWPKPEGVAVIFQTQDGKVVYKGMIKPTDWPEPQ